MENVTHKVNLFDISYTGGAGTLASTLKGAYGVTHLVLVISADDVEDIKNLVKQIKDTQHGFGEVRVDLYDVVNFEFQNKDDEEVSLENLEGVGLYEINDAHLVIDTDNNAYLWVKFLDFGECSSYFTIRVDVASLELSLMMSRASCQKTKTMYSRMLNAIE